MADSRKQLEAYKAAASTYQSDIATAATKDEALTLAIQCAENLMKAIKIAPTAQERAQLKSKCQIIMDVADRIKSSAQWTSQSLPSADAQFSTRDSVKSPAAYLEAAASPTSFQAPSPAEVFQTNNFDRCLINSSPTAFKSPDHYTSPPVNADLLRAQPSTNREKASWVTTSNDWQTAITGANSTTEVPIHSLAALTLASDYSSVPPSAASSSHIRILKEPISSRKRSKKEEILLLKASLINGFKFPPWEKHPPSSEFTLEPGSERFRNLGKPLLSPNGKYVVRLNFNGCWRKVVIDDRLPMSNTPRLLHVIDRRNPALLWPALLEKAYLKVRGGYDFPGSNSCSDLWTLTGWIPEEVYLQETDTVPVQLWKRIYNAFLYGDVLVTLGTGKMSSKQERELGLEGRHSYSVLDMKETDDDKWLLVKNPWVEGKGWRGPRPPNAPGLDTSSSIPTSSKGAGFDNRDPLTIAEKPHPTTFWIGLDHVIQHFERLYLNWNPGLFGYRQDIHFEWAIGFAQTFGGCVVNHPQFSFSSHSGGPAWLLLSRHFRDSIEDSKTASDAFNDGSIRPETHIYSSGDPLKGYMSIYVCPGDGERLYIKESYLESSPYVNTPQCLLRYETEPKKKYTIVIDQDELPSSTYTFSLSAFSNSAVALEPASSRYQFQKVEQSAWTKRTAGGNTGSRLYFDNPQYCLEVRKRCSLAILLTSGSHGNPLHAKLVIGYGKRIYKLQSRDVLADSGDHRARCALARMQELEPGLYTIICSLFEAGQTGDYTLRVDSTEDITLRPIARDGAGLVPTRLAPACFGAQAHKIAAPLVPNRLASYTIVARFIKATSPRSRDLGLLGRSPLRLSVELGRGPERKFLIASEHGEYSDTAIVRSESINIDPADLHGGDLWIVLDRLSGTGGPVEEWYEVEVFSDVPNAFQIGVWRDWDN